MTSGDSRAAAKHLLLLTALWFAFSLPARVWVRFEEETRNGSDRLGLRVVLVFGAVLVLTQQMVAEGVVLSVSWQQNALLLQTAEGFSLVAVDSAAKIDDAVGAIHTLSDLQSGDVIEYHGASFGGILIVDKLRVISISYDEKAENRRPSNQPHRTPPASHSIPTRHD